jgi:hypothetical protein
MSSCGFGGSAGRVGEDLLSLRETERAIDVSFELSKEARVQHPSDR